MTVKATLQVPSGNGRGKVKLLDRSRLDGRRKEAKLYDSVVGGITQDLAGPDQLSTVEHNLIHAFAGIAVHVNSLNARLLLGEEVDLNAHATACSTLVRIASRIGLGRRAKDVTAPRLHEYLAQSVRE